MNAYNNFQVVGKIIRKRLTKDGELEVLIKTIKEKKDEPDNYVPIFAKSTIQKKFEYQTEISDYVKVIGKITSKISLKVGHLCLNTYHEASDFMLLRKNEFGEKIEESGLEVERIIRQYDIGGIY